MRICTFKSGAARAMCAVRSAVLFVMLLWCGTAAAMRYYVAPTAQGTGDGLSWGNATTLSEALIRAVAGDEIWALGFSEITDKAAHVYTVPAEGLTLKSGVRLYGGFAGTETALADRARTGKAFTFANRSVLSGDLNGDDAVTGEHLIFPGNGTRKDNARHVLVMDLDPSKSDNNNHYLTVVDGFTIMGGHAAGTGADSVGGGVSVINGGVNGAGAYRIENCFLFNNYAKSGGAVYVDASVVRVAEVSLISRCAMYNNAAGERSVEANDGAGIYLAGYGVVVNSSLFNNDNGGVKLSTAAQVINTTVVRNTGGGIGMIEEYSGGYNVYNTVVWGNNALYSSHAPQFSHSAYPEDEQQGGDAGNVQIDVSNRAPGVAAAMFESPSTKAGYDIDFEWREMAYPLWSWSLLEGSALMDKGDDAAYDASAYGANDMAMAVRTDASGAIDIGVYEYQHTPANRIVRVKPDGDDGNDGSSWDKAYRTVQRAIDALASADGGEVWVAAGVYAPTTLMDPSDQTTAAFVMKDGVSVYGGFAGTEDSRAERQKKEGGMPWEFVNVTVFEASGYMLDAAKWNGTDNRWSVTSSSNHVVWFDGTDAGGTDFGQVTVLDGVTVRGGHATASYTGTFGGGCGAGVYMDNRNARLTNCIVAENAADGNGGGVYLGGGRIEGCLLYNNGADGNGGAVYINNSGLVLRSMLANNAADNGAGAYLANGGNASDGHNHPEYLILSTSVVSNNTARKNGAVYCDRGGVLIHNTITNNSAPRATDVTDPQATRTGGLYIDSYTLAINTILWNNAQSGRDVPMYAVNPTQQNVRFYNSAISGMNNAIWNGTLQSSLTSLAGTNRGGESEMNPEFAEGGAGTNMPDENAIDTKAGVQGDWTSIDYFWQPVQGANLRAIGMELSAFPDEVLLAPELDIKGTLFSQKPSAGAHMISQQRLAHVQDGENLVLYVDTECTDPTHDGSSWDKGYRSLNEAIAYFSKMTDVPAGVTRLVVCVMEGEIFPRYAHTGNDPKSATINIPAMKSGKPIVIMGGFERRPVGERTNLRRNPVLFRTVIDGNPEGRSLEEGLHHNVTVGVGANVYINGFHIINGYAAGDASIQYGAGILVYDNATLYVRNTVFENNTAYDGAAISVVDPRTTQVKVIELDNCVINNNTNTNPYGNDALVTGNVKLDFVSIVNNSASGAIARWSDTSFSAGNRKGTNTHEDMSVDASMFENPTTAQGATVGFRTYYGGNSSFRPANANPVVNKAGDARPVWTGQDITVEGSRSTGGAADLGAFESDMPADGTVIYVRTDGNDNNDGLAWDRAYATITKALSVANAGQDIWVAAGEYVENVIMKEGVNVLGGFAKTGSPKNELDGINRDISHTLPEFTTTINGKNGAIVREKYNLDDISKRVLTQPNDFTTPTTWEGFVLTGGYTAIDKQGAGANLMNNGILKNCRITGNTYMDYGNLRRLHQEHSRLGWRPGEYLGNWETLTTNNSSVGSGGGGVYCAKGGLVENCQIVGNNLLCDNNTSWDGYLDDDTRYRYSTNNSGSLYARGAGLYIDGGSVINTIIAENYVGYCGFLGRTDNTDFTNVLGTAVYVSSESYFYNCSVVRNGGGWSNSNHPIIPGVWDNELNSTFYNCIVAGNMGYGNTRENYSQIGKGIHGIPANLYYTYFTYVADVDGEPTVDPIALFPERNNKWNTDLQSLGINDYDDFLKSYANQNILDASYELVPQAGNPCLNTGNEDYVNGVSGPVIDIDAKGRDRIQDCAVDMGAYESDNAGNIAHAEGEYIYYVSMDGAGLRNGSSPDNAACEMKLQDILNAAGRDAAAGNRPVVKIAGYENATMNNQLYNANRLSDGNDPQSYTFTVPYGVTVMGGYNENGTPAFDDATRNAARYMTVLTPKAVKEGQEVNGYHVVTFGEKPADWTGADVQTIVDGIYLEGGKATATAGTGNDNTRGGGAIVPAWGHLRNCVVRGNEAVEGGGLYLKAGAMVSGCGIIGNTATDFGGGVYADEEGVTDELRAHLISSTVADNESGENGGGIYMEVGALLSLNSVVHGNRAPGDKNISGVVSLELSDKMLSDVTGETDVQFYPFNNCFLETYDMPSRLANTSMVSDRSVYFTGDYYTLKAYSELVKHGSVKEYQTRLVDLYGVAERDMQNIPRVSDRADRIDAGAYAYDGEIMEIPTSPGDVAYTLFVSQSLPVEISDAQQAQDFYGKSFYTSLSWLDDAFEYIRKVRANPGLMAGGKTFRVLIAGGTYRPHFARDNSSVEMEDQRQNSFVIPDNVEVYGGFAGSELLTSYSDGAVIGSAVGQGVMTVVDDAALSAALDARELSDLNGNGVEEEYEFASQTILSGEVNASATERNVYHVLYSEADGVAVGVTLDGLTVMGGVTNNEEQQGADNEVGRGGGIYSDGVPYTINRSRLMGNRAVKGGAVYVRNARLTLASSVVAGNSTEANDNATAAGGAIAVVTTGSADAGLYAVNTIFANNGTAGRGGVISTFAGGTAQPLISVMNCAFVMNKAGENATIYNSNANSTVTNSIFWGNELPEDKTDGFGTAVSLSHCAGDNLPEGGTDNVTLAADNMSVYGPRFMRPSAVAGVEGNSAESAWNPVSISVLTDAGDGTLPADVSDMSQASGAYAGWMSANRQGHETQYMDGVRYAGPKKDDGSQDDKPIDIGPYEYQYPSVFNDMERIYVAGTESGRRDGTSWDNATSDLRGAMIGMANSVNPSPEKYIYIREGDYTAGRLYNLGGKNVMYNLSIDAADDKKTVTIYIEGAHNESGQQDFGSPSVISVAEGAELTPDVLLNINANGRNVVLRGISFDGTNAPGVTGLEINNAKPDGNKVSVNNSAFRHNGGAGALLSSGSALFANVLFADGGTGIRVDGGTATVVNSTFANNTAAVGGQADVYNSVAWRSGSGVTDNGTNHNHDFDTVANNDVMRGPNFVDPDNGDYSIRPSLMILNRGDNTLYQTHVGADPAAENDLGGTARLVDEKIDLGAYEYGAPLRQLLYVKSDVAVGDGSGSSWDNAIRDLASAVDLAALYAEGNPGKAAYVFADRVVNVPSITLATPDVKLYGGMNGETASATDAAAQAEELLRKRAAVIDGTAHSTIQTLNLSAASVVDGFYVTDATVNNGGMLSTSVVDGVTADGDGTLYNSFVRTAAAGSGRYVNVTSPGDIPAGYNNNANAEVNGYVAADIWSYQPMENHGGIDNGTDITAYIRMAGHSRDLAGAARVRNAAPDHGCFELWNITEPTVITSDDRPLPDHVVYVREGVELSIAPDVYTGGNSFSPGFLLLEHGAGLVGNANSVALTNFAVERSLSDANGHKDLASLPFRITRASVNRTDGISGVTVSRYDGAARAAYNYKYDGADGTAWKPLGALSERDGLEGLLLEADADTKVRFYGNSYQESDVAKDITLAQHNFDVPWNDDSGTGNRFTHPENMGWNLFGSPFLCAMNYEDMEYGRVIYTFDGTEYATAHTWNRESAAPAQGSIPAGTAVFTQTATLASAENLAVTPRTGDAQQSLPYAGNLAVEFAAVADDADDGTPSDMIQITAVESADSRSEFLVNADGVKWMAPQQSAPQIYMLRDGGRYSLLSAVDIEGQVDVGVSVPAPASYEFRIPADCDTYDYETVFLKDAQANTLTDLKDRPYTFFAPEAGETNGRFSIIFRRVDDVTRDGLITVYTPYEGMFVVEGMDGASEIRLYDTSGRMIERRTSTSRQETFRALRGVYLVEVHCENSAPTVIKVLVK